MIPFSPFCNSYLERNIRSRATRLGSAHPNSNMTIILPLTHPNDEILKLSAIKNGKDM
jgi:hypothetical protein